MSSLADAPRVELGGLVITALTRAEWAQALIDDHRRSRAEPGLPRLLSSANGNVVSLFGRDPAFRRLVSCIDAVDVDGRSILVREAIAGGHKIALTRIAANDAVIKYGSPIGTAILDIEPGAHVHTHNVASTRGRGDLVSSDTLGKT